jgi:hypothetical protein
VNCIGTVEGCCPPEFDDAPKHDLCKGLNVAVDCDDNDASTIDDCQHSVGCYHIPWSFYEGLAAALPGVG